MMDLNLSSISHKLLLGVLALFLCMQLRGQSAEFSVPDQACLLETLSIDDQSNLLLEYEWDFCHNDLSNLDQVVDIDNITGGSSIQSLKLVYDSGSWYGFTGSRLTDEILRLDFGSTLLEEKPAVVSIGNLGEASLRPNGIDFAMESNIWYGFFANQNGDLIKVTFNNGLGSSNFLTDNLGDLSSWLFIYDVDLEYDDENSRWIIAVADANGDKITMIDLGSSLATATPSTILDIGTAEGDITNSRGIDLIQTNSGWYQLIADVGSDKIILASFGTDPFTEPTYSTLLDITNPTKIRVKKEGLRYVAYALTASGLERMTFGEDLTNLIGTESLGTFSGTLSANNVALDFEKFQQSWVGFTVSNLDNDLARFTFSSVCSSDMTIDASNNPSPIVQYLSQGDYLVELNGYDQYGNLFTRSDTVNILPQTAPSIAYTSDNICVSSLVTFTPSNTGLTFSWDFDDDGIEDSNAETPQVDFSALAGVGDYMVRVDVNDGTCNNFYEELITIYPEPPVPSFSVDNSTQCTNTPIEFTNETDSSQHLGVISYMWDFDSDGIIDSTDPNPTFQYTTSGTKTVILYDTIPGCSNVSSTFNIEILAGPTSDFTQTSNTACEGETITFFDNSTGAVSYSWNFDNGFTSTLPNPPAQLFENSGSYFVSLVTTDAQSCRDSIAQEIVISATPEININFDIPCTSPDGVQFFDESTVTGADIIGWAWEVDGEQVSTEQNPIINFTTTGIKTIGLTVTSDNGCEQYSTEDIDVRAAPSPDFSINLGCQGEASFFTDETESAGNPIISWLWTVDGVNYATQDISHVFSGSGTFDVVLEVTGQNFCSETITQTVEIIELPQVDFSVNGECDNQVIRAIDQSSGSADPVISRRWNLDGENVGNGTQLLLSDLEDATYELELELETEAGCLIRSSQTLEINDAPESSFTSSRTYGIPNDRLTFTNSSSGGISYQWLLDDLVRSTDPTSESITFIEPGTYNVSLVTQNSLGCYDTARQEVLIAIPEVDLSIGTFELVDENTTGRIFLEVQNRSNLPVEITEAQITLQNQFTVTEQILEFIDVGESSLVNLNVGIPLTVSEPSYFCVILTSQYVDYADVNPVDNEKCLTIMPDVQVEDPFPNPVVDEFRLKVIAPSAGEVRLRLINSAGKIQKDQSFQAIEGLNNFFVEMSALDPGIYYISGSVLGTTFKRKVIKL